MKFEGVRFLLIFTIWIFILSLLVYFVLLSDVQKSSIIHYAFHVSHAWSRLRIASRFMDDWNFMTLIFLICMGIIFLCLNELFLKKIFPTPVETKSSEFVTGLMWFARTLSNVLVLAVETTVICYLINLFVATPKMHSNIDSIPQAKYTVLLLGTSKTILDKKAENKYYTTRIEAVVQLYREGLMQKLIISGDHTGSDNEPLDMLNDLRRMGVNLKDVILDGKGFRTFDSIIRAKLLGGKESVIIVSQYFHLERALFLADKQGVDAIGFVAGGWPNKKMIKREWLAKTKVLLDVYILNTQTAGIPVRPRRGVNFYSPADCIILLFVLSSVALAGHLSRQLLSY